MNHRPIEGETMKRKKIARLPTETYTQCPACKSESLIRLEIDVLCAECDWDSTAAFVESGGMDNLFQAYCDHFALGKKNALSPAKANSATSPDLEPLAAEDIFENKVSA
jgi:hypothetical protein